MPSTRNRTALYGLVGSIFISGTGIGSLLPILPLYLRERGASYALLGVIVGASLFAQAIGQWPAGLLAERFGRREMMVIGLVVAAAASISFLLPLSVEWPSWRRSPTWFLLPSLGAPTAGFRERSRPGS